MDSKMSKKGKALLGMETQNSLQKLIILVAIHPERMTYAHRYEI